MNQTTRNLHKWFHNEWRNGYPIECVLLQKCDYAVRTQVEKEWMARFPGLLNEQRSVLTRVAALCGTTPKIPEITAYIRKYIFNVGGFVGVHYEHDWDRYFVLMYTGVGAQWLLGNEMPVGGGNIWFSDPTAALKARDDARRCFQFVKWPPDREPSAVCSEASDP